MIYAASITEAKGGNEQSATRTTLKISAGLIWLIEVDFPAGCVGLVHLRIFDGKYQLFPSSPGVSLAGDGVVLKYDDLYLKDNKPTELTLETWNEDTIYSHTLQVRIGVASSRAFQARYLPTITWEEIDSALATAAKIQTKQQEEQLAEIIKNIQGG